MTHISPRAFLFAFAGFAFALAACTEVASDPPQSGQPPQQAQSQEMETAPLPAAQAQRLQRIMAPLIQKMDNPIPPKQVKMTLIADNGINAANGGGGGGGFFATHPATGDRIETVQRMR